MKTIGLIGGMSWESTIPYYRHINEAVKQRLGGLHSAKIVLYSVDFQEVERYQRAGDWEAAGKLLAGAAAAVQAAGADILLLCTNTMHKVASALEAAAAIPLIHIADATAEEVKRAGLSTVGLLGTRFTMEEAFYKARLEERFNLKVLVPEAADRDLVHRVIYQELCLGTVAEASGVEYRRIIAGLVARGAEGIILGCTEIALLVGSADSQAPLFDTARIHAQKAVDVALG